MSPAAAPAAAPRPAPRSAPAAQPLDPAAAERQRFYALLWGDASGYAYVVAGLPVADIAARGWPLGADEAGAADPDNSISPLLWSRASYDSFKAAGRPHTGKVFEWPAEARALDRYAARLAAEYDNVFCRPYLADSREAAKHGEPPAVAQVVRVEDAPADPGPLAPAYTFAVETSEGSYHAYWRLAAPAPWPTIQRLAAGAVERLGADSGGPNPAQLTRIPSTRNTKARAGRWRVRLVEPGGPVGLGELAGALLPGGLAGGSTPAPRSARPSASAAGDVADLASWQAAPVELGHQLLATPRWPVLLTRRPQLAQLLRGERVALSVEGQPDDSDSAQLAVLVSHLLTTGRAESPGGPIVPGLGAPPLVEIRAVIRALAPRLLPGYSERRLMIDTDRLFMKYTPATYAPEATRTMAQARPTAPAPALPATLPPPRYRGRGRPAGQRAQAAERLADLLAGQVGQVVARPALAEMLGLSLRAVGYLLADLQNAGRLDLRRRRAGLEVVRCAINSPRRDVQLIPAAEGADPAPMPQTPADGTRSNTPARMGGAGGAPAPAAPAPSALESAPAPAAAELPPLAELVGAALVELAGGLDPDTGELVEPRRATLAAVRRLLVERYPGLDLAGLKEAAAEARQQRQAERSAAYWQAEREKVGAMADGALMKLCRRRAVQAAQAAGGFDAKRRAALASLADDERARRLGQARALAEGWGRLLLVGLAGGSTLWPLAQLASRRLAVAERRAQALDLAQLAEAPGPRPRRKAADRSAALGAVARLMTVERDTLDAAPADLRAALPLDGDTPAMRRLSERAAPPAGCVSPAGPQPVEAQHIEGRPLAQLVEAVERAGWAALPADLGSYPADVCDALLAAAERHAAAAAEGPRGYALAAD